MREITLEELLEAGCHFGHQVTRSNPKARDFIFEARDNIHIIDLEKTKQGLEEAAAYIKKLAQSGGNLIIVGTKRQARPVIQKEIEALTTNDKQRVFFVTNRWIGGTLTNFSEVLKNFKKLKDLRLLLQDSEQKAIYTKKEIGMFEKERQKLEGLYGGIAEMTKIPDALFIIDTHLEDLAVREAKKMNVATVGIVDTNADPAGVDYAIPANDDASGSIELITKYIVEAWREGLTQQAASDKQQEKQITEKETKAQTSLKEKPKKEKKKKEVVETQAIETEEKPKKRGRKPKAEK